MLTVASYAVYCGFDLLGRRTTGHTLDRGRVLAIGFVSHAAALSLGPAGAGVRFRLALHHGLPAHLIAALWLFNVATNWLGFMVVAGTRAGHARARRCPPTGASDATRCRGWASRCWRRWPPTWRCAASAMRSR